MDLLHNPFYILAATPRDKHARIIDLAEERSLLLDADACMAARLALTTPRKRLAAEAAWLPGIGPKRAEEVLAGLEPCPSGMPDARPESTPAAMPAAAPESTPAAALTADMLPPAARLNALAAALSRLPEYRADTLVDWMLALAAAFEAIDAEKLRALINEERTIAEFPEVTDTAAVEEEIQNRRRHACQVIKAALDNLASTELVEAITRAVESATDTGEKPCPVLLADLVDAYEVDAQEFLHKEEATILALAEKLQTAVDAGSDDAFVMPMADTLIRVVKNWDFVAQPIQVSTKSRGLDHEASLRLAKTLRNLAVHVVNEHRKIELSQKLVRMLQEVFAEVAEIAELTAEDADTLDDLTEQRDRWIEGAQDRAEAWRQEISFEADLGGAVFTAMLRIAPEGIEWKGRNWPLDSITRIRWGGTSHSIYGIPTGTTYIIAFGNAADQASLELKTEVLFNSIVDRLWKAVCVRLLTDFLHNLREGQKYRFGDAVVSDDGVELSRKKFFNSNERVFCPWNELSVWSAQGAFCMEKKGDEKTLTPLSYQDVYNTHILEAAVRTFWKQGGTRISSILES